MNFLENTDDEILRYEEAEIFRANAKPEFFPDEMKSKFNTRTGMTDLFAPLPSGGFAKLASQAPNIMVESPAMPGVVQPFSGQPVPLPVEGPLARAAESQPKPKQDTAQLGFFDNATSEIGKGLIRGAIVEPANFLKDNFGLYDPLVVQLVDPVTGEFDFDIKILSREEKADLDAKMAAGEMPYAISLDELVASDETAGTGSQAIGGMAQFVGAFAGLGKLFRVGQGFKAGMTQGAAADFLGFDGSDAGITDLLLSFGVPDAMLPDFLEKDPNDPDYIGRLQAAFEGAFFGGVIEKLIPIVGKVFRSIKDGDVPAEVVTQSISDGKEAMRQALLSAGENAQTRITERGTGTTMMSGVDPTVITDPLVAAAGRAAGVDRVGEIKTQMRQIQDERRLNNNLARNGELNKLKRELKEIDQSGDGNFSIVEPPTDTKPGIIAFHGSAADFDGFKLEKIGTGEGAQAYGYGLYFADSEEIAKFYKESLTEVPADYQIDGQSVSAMYDQAINNQKYELAEVLEQVQLHDAPKDLKERFTIDGGYSQETQDFVRDLDYDNLTGVNPDGEEIELGRVYKVGLTPKPEDLLDYDKSFSEQTPAIQAALEKAGYKSEYNMVALEDGNGRFGVYETDEAGKRTFVKHFNDGLMGMSAEAQANEYIKEVNATLPKNTGGQILDVLASDLAKKATAPTNTRLDEINIQLRRLAKEMEPFKIPGTSKFNDPKGDALSAEYGALMTERADLPKFKRKDARRLASDVLEQAGIPGIKYRDGASRGDDIEDVAADRNLSLIHI